MLDLANYLPYLLNRVGTRLATDFSRTLRDRFAINLSAWRVIAALHHADGQRVGQLAEMTSIEISTLSRVLDTLQERGFLARRRPTDDARGVTAHLTKSGFELTERIIPLARYYEAAALSDFSTEEAAILRTLLKRAFANLRALPDLREMSTML